MSNKPIAVGDFVMVVRRSKCPCATPSGVLGMVFKVKKVTEEKVFCLGCGAIRGVERLAYGLQGNSIVEAERLIRIDPPAIDTTAETERELTV